MASHNGARTKTEGLAFVYDMNNPESFKGDATTNLWAANKSRYSWTTGTGTVTRDVPSSEIAPPFYFPGGEVVKVQSTSDVFGTILWTVPGIQGPDVTYAHSIWVYLVEGDSVGIGQHWNPWSYNHLRYPKKGRWERIEHINTTVDSTHTSVAIQYNVNKVGGGGIAYFYAPQYEKNSFVTEFVNGTRGTTDLLIDRFGKRSITVSNIAQTRKDKFKLADTTHNMSIPSVISNTDYTVCAFVKCDQLGRTNPIIGDYQYNWWRFYINSSGYLVAGHKQSDSLGGPNVTATVPITDTSYHHVAVTFSTSGGIYLYLDGEQVGYQNNTRPFTLTGRGPQYIGQHRGGAPGSPDRLLGELPYLQIYTRALSANEIKENFNAQKSVYGFENNKAGPLAFYDFSRDSLKDLSKNHNDLTLVGSAAHTSGKYWHFNADSYLKTTLTPNGFKNLTLMGWFRVSSTNSGWQDVICSYDSPSASANWCRLALYQGKATLYVDANNSNNIVQSTYTPPLNTWVFLVGVREGSTGKVYINGELIKTATTSTAAIGSGTENNFVLGNISRPTNLSEDLIGDIGYAKIYDRALTDDEIRKTYYKTLRKFL